MNRRPVPFAILLRHELRLIGRDRGVMIALLLFAAAIAAALHQGVDWRDRQASAVTAIMAAEDARLDSLMPRIREAFAATDSAERAQTVAYRLATALGQSYLAPLAVMEPGPLAAIATGQSDLFPRSVRITPRSFQSLDLTSDMSNPVHLADGRFDIAFVMVYLLPLLLIALSYNVLSGDRDRGTLAMIAAQPTAPRRLLAARLTARALPAMALVLLTALVLKFTGGAGAGALILPWLIGVLAYLAFWLGAALWCNGRQSSSSANAVFLATLWLGVVIVLPALLHAAGRVVHPTPSRVELIGTMREATRVASAEGASALAEYFHDHPELVRNGDVEAAMESFMARTYAVQDMVDRQIQPLDEGFATALANQQRLAARWQLLSPALVLHLLSTETAGSGAAAFTDYRSKVRQLHRRWQEMFIVPMAQGREMALPALERRPQWERGVLVAAGTAERQWRAVMLLLAASLLVWGGALATLQSGAFPAPGGGR